jgi:hypothetical protein
LKKTTTLIVAMSSSSWTGVIALLTQRSQRHAEGTF